MSFIQGLIAPSVREPVQRLTKSLVGTPTLYDFLDTFNAGNGINFTALIPDVDRVGDGWTVVAGVAEIQSTAVDVTTAPFEAVITGSHFVGSVQFDWKRGASGDVRLFARYTDTNNWVALFIDNTVMALYVNTASSAAAVGDTVAHGLNTNNFHTFKIVFSGSDYTMYANGSLVLSRTSSSHATATKKGFLASNAAHFIDNFQVV